eukprot:Seg255.3 transcript_id=Seg255.3/GoldUCD/mRNA.D3Y31 product="hypothetical protein" protein_id=Seg255.3/GoldUCD/D3Y31
MPFNFFKRSKKSKSRSEESQKCEVDQDETQSCIESKRTQTQPVDVPQPVTRSIPTVSRMGQYSGSRASSIGRLSLASGMTHTSSMSTASTTSKASTKSTKSNWSYDVDRFKGPKNLPKKMESRGHQDIWAQAYAFGGR